MSYSSNVKQEITQKIPVTNLECLAEISSIFENKANLVKEGIEIKMENSILAKRLYSLIKATSSLQFGIKYSITKKFTEHRIYVITLYKQKGLKEFLESFKFSFLDIIQNDEIFRGYLRGFFLSCGYIKDPKKEYSLDFFVDNKELADKIYNILLSKKKKIFKTIKKNKILVYLRNSEDIMDLLVSMNALKYFFEYEEITIIKNLKNKTIREMNWEVANETKTLNTGNYQIKMIKYIDEKLGLNTLTDVLKEAAMLRLNNPEDSLQSLADIMKNTVKLEDVNLNININIGKNWAEAK